MPNQYKTFSDTPAFIFELRPEAQWSDKAGYTVTRKWVGPKSAIESFSNGLIADSAGTQFSAGGPGGDGANASAIEYDDTNLIATLTVSWQSREFDKGYGPNSGTNKYPTAAKYELSSLWTLAGNEVERSILAHPNSKALNSAAGKGFANRIKQAVEKYESGEDKDGEALADGTDFALADYIDSSTWTGLSSSQQALAVNLADDLLDGVEAYPISQYVLQNVKVANRDSPLTVYHADVNKIWTTSQLLTVIQGDNNNPLTNNNTTLPLIGNLSTTFANEKWLYKTPTANQMQDGKWQIAREWQQAKDYSDYLYDQKT